MKRSMFFVSLLLIVLVAFACGKKEPMSPELQQGEQRATVAKSSEGAATTQANHFVVEFTGTVDQLTSAVAALGGTVESAHSEIGVAKVSGLNDEQANTLKKAQGIKSVTRDLVAQWVDPNCPCQALSLLKFLTGRLGSRA